MYRFEGYGFINLDGSRRASMSRPRPRLNYANVVATLALIIAVGGASSLAASQLGKNTVGSKQLRKNSVTTAKVKKDAITGAKVRKGSLTGRDINLKKLGTVPNAAHAITADLAKTISPAEPTHVVGTGGEPPFEGGSSNIQLAHYQHVGFFKDQEGIVHLEGLAVVGKGGPVPGTIFRLPPGFRPTSGTQLLFEQLEDDVAIVIGSNLNLEGKELGGLVLGDDETVSLDGITFRAES